MAFTVVGNELALTLSRELDESGDVEGLGKGRCCTDAADPC